MLVRAAGTRRAAEGNYKFKRPGHCGRRRGLAARTLPARATLHNALLSRFWRREAVETRAVPPDVRRKLLGENAYPAAAPQVLHRGTGGHS
jgi:hypothetical protein